MRAELNERQTAIMDRLAVHGEVKVAELKSSFDVTEMTVRRDLEKLEQLGLLRRTFGGAIPSGRDVALRERTALHAEEKLRIGRHAAAFVQPGDNVFLDGGSTTLQVARHLSVQHGITAVTNALNVAAELLERRIPTIVIGGVLVEATQSLVGPIAADALGRMAFDHAFIGTTGLTAEHGFSNSNVYEAEIKRLVIAQAGSVTVVLDRSKFGQRDLVSFAAAHDVHRIVCDEEPEAELKHRCRSAGVHIVTA